MTDQFITSHQSEIDEADFLSRYGRENADEREACVDAQLEIWARLIDAAPAGDGDDA